MGSDPVNAIAGGQSAQATAALDGPADATANGANGTATDGAANGAGAADPADAADARTNLDGEGEPSEDRKSVV